jgi:hypothetical protein
VKVIWGEVGLQGTRRGAWRQESWRSQSSADVAAVPRDARDDCARRLMALSQSFPGNTQRRLWPFISTVKKKWGWGGETRRSEKVARTRTDTRCSLNRHKKPRVRRFSYIKSTSLFMHLILIVCLLLLFLVVLKLSVTVSWKLPLNNADRSKDSAMRVSPWCVAASRVWHMLMYYE